MINQLELHYTSEMEKAMHGAYKVGYKEYSRKLNIRMKVEKQREADYLKSQRVVNHHYLLNRARF